MVDAERALQEISRTFRGSKFADAVLVALARAAAGKRLEEQDKQAINSAAGFLEQVECGYKWIEDPQISSTSLQCAFSFQTAIRSSTPGISPDQFREEMKAMLETAKALANDGEPAKEAIERIRRFFYEMLRIEVNDFDEIFSIPTGRLGSWELLGSSLF